MIEIIQSEKQTEEKNPINGGDKMSHRRTGEEEYLNNGQKLPKFDENINLDIQEAQQTPNSMNSKTRHATNH